MSASEIQSTKLELIQWISSLTDASIIGKIADIQKKEVSDWWDSTSSIEQESIEKGIKESDNGILQSHSKARKLYDHWL